MALADLRTIKMGWNLLPYSSFLPLPPLLAIRTALRASPAPWPVTQAADSRMEGRGLGSWSGMERKEALSCWQGGVVTTSSPCKALGAEKCANTFVNIGVKQRVGVTGKSLLSLPSVARLQSSIPIVKEHWLSSCRLHFMSKMINLHKCTYNLPFRQEDVLPPRDCTTYASWPHLSLRGKAGAFFIQYVFLAIKQVRCLSFRKK